MPNIQIVLQEGETAGHGYGYYYGQDHDKCHGHGLLISGSSEFHLLSSNGGDPCRAAGQLKAKENE